MSWQVVWTMIMAMGAILRANNKDERYITLGIISLLVLAFGSISDKYIYFDRYMYMEIHISNLWVAISLCFI